MSIQKIVITCYKKDLHLARICVGSIRFWYPDVEILLLKDEGGEAFSTREIEEAWSVGVLKTERRSFGWGMGKLEVLFLPGAERVLVVDADTVFLGPVLEELAAFPEEFVVSGYAADAASALVGKSYFHPDRLGALDPDYRYPGYVFNTGQMVITTGRLRREDFDRLVRWDSPPRPERPDIFRNADQGLLNYLLVKKAAGGAISLRCHLFHGWPLSEGTESLSLDRIAAGGGYPLIMHWAGLQSPLLSRMPRADILYFFEDFYYTRVNRPGERKRRGRKLLLRYLAERPEKGVRWALNRLSKWKKKIRSGR